jgi:4-hydroxybenzoate polyprenyltransferase
MLNWLKLIRIQNLAIIIATQYAIRYLVVWPMLKYMNLYIQFQLSHLEFFLLVLSTTLIAGAGYVINDYFDTRIDRINKPQHVLVSKEISRRQAMMVHSVMNIIGVALGFYVAWKSGMIKLGFIHVFCTGLLWFYSTDFKKQFLVGNLVISFLTAMVPMMVALFDLPPIIQAYHEQFTQLNINLNFILKFVSGFALFAFMTTFIREIIKDLEDREGDEAFGCRTLPIVLGVNKAKVFVMVINIITMALLAMVMSLQWQSNDMKSFLYFLVTLQIPMAVLCVQLIKAQTPRHYHLASRTLKLIMIAGVSFSVLYYLSF